MKCINHLFAILLGIALSFASSTVLAKDKKYYEVTIPNLTSNIVLSPILVASHRKGVKIFNLGEEASYELGRVAEGGDIVPMTDLLTANNEVVDVADSGGPLGPGESVTVEVDAKHGAKYLTVASMILPTNDGFIALNGVKIPRSRHDLMTFYSPVYDAGTEVNDELCAHIPGPMCGGDPFSDAADSDEGYVHIHSGIHGNGDLLPEIYDWRNPAAKITIKRK